MEQQGNTNEYMLRFTAGGVSYMLPVSEVERILSLQRDALSPLPFGMGKRMEGLFSFRGAVLPLLRISDAACCETGDGGDLTVVLMGTGAKRFGLAVSSADFIEEKAASDAVSVSAQSLYEGSVAEV